MTREDTSPGPLSIAGCALGRGTFLGVAAIATLLSGAPARAQQFGQWSWQAALGATGRSYRTSIGDLEASSLDERDLRLALGLNGFIVHPAIARFELGVDAALSQSDSTRNLDARRWGFRASLSLLPRGVYPLGVYGRREFHSYSELAEDDPLFLRGLPATTSSFGGRLRARRGLLSGTLLGFDHSVVAYEEPVAGSAMHEEAFLQWSRTGRRFHKQLRLDRRARDFGTVDYRTRELALNYNQRGAFSEAWRWQWTTTGIHRSLTYVDTDSSFDTLRTYQSLVHPMRGDDSLDLRYDGGLTRGSGSSTQTHALRTRYWWRPDGPWTVSPFVTIGLQLSDGRSLLSPQVGMSATWQGFVRSVEVTANNSLAYSELRRSGTEDLEPESQLAIDFQLSFRHGDPETLDKELDLSWSRNQLRVAGEPLSELPDLGASVSGLGTEDRLRGRLTLRRRWRSFSFYGYSEGHRFELSERPGIQASTVQTLNHSVQVSGSPFSLTGSLGGSDVEGGSTQSVSYRSIALTWRPVRLLSLDASYRADVREVEMAPDVEGERYEARARFWFGAFVLTGRAFLTVEQNANTPERVNKGLVVSISRRFAGWLPIVTGPRDTGVVR